MTWASDVPFIRSTFGLGQRDLARVLSVSPATVDRWESGESTPAGLHDEVLRALHGVAISVQGDEDRRRSIAVLVSLGVGALIFYLLTQPELAGVPNPGEGGPPRIPGSYRAGQR